MAMLEGHLLEKSGDIMVERYADPQDQESPFNKPLVTARHRRTRGSELPTMDEVVPGAAHDFD